MNAFKVKKIVGEKISTELINAENFTIGRSQKDNFIIDEGGVSRRHLLIKAEGNVIWLTDNGSSNGTFLNGKKLEAQKNYQYESGSIIRLANSQTRVALELVEGVTPTITEVTEAVGVIPEAEEMSSTNLEERTSEIPSLPISSIEKQIQQLNYETSNLEEQKKKAQTELDFYRIQKNELLQSLANIEQDNQKKQQSYSTQLLQVQNEIQKISAEFNVKKIEMDVELDNLKNKISKAQEEIQQMEVGRRKTGRQIEEMEQNLKQRQAELSLVEKERSENLMAVEDLKTVQVNFKQEIAKIEKQKIEQENNLLLLQSKYGEKERELVLKKQAVEREIADFERIRKEKQVELEGFSKELESKVEASKKEMSLHEIKKEGLLERIKQVANVKQQKEEEVAKVNGELIELMDLKEEKEKELVAQRQKIVEIEESVAQLNRVKAEEFEAIEKLKREKEIVASEKSRAQEEIKEEIALYRDKLLQEVENEKKNYQAGLQSLVLEISEIKAEKKELLKVAQKSKIEKMQVEMEIEELTVSRQQTKKENDSLVNDYVTKIDELKLKMGECEKTIGAQNNAIEELTISEKELKERIFKNKSEANQSEERVVETSKNLLTIKKEFEDCLDQLSQTKFARQQILQSIEEQKRELSSLQAEVKGTNSEINQNNATINGLKQREENLHSTIKSLVDEKGALEKGLHDLDERLKILNQEIVRTEAKTEEKKSEGFRLDDALKLRNGQLQQIESTIAEKQQIKNDVEQKYHFFKNGIEQLREQENEKKNSVFDLNRTANDLVVVNKGHEATRQAMLQKIEEIEESKANVSEELKKIRLEKDRALEKLTATEQEIEATIKNRQSIQREISTLVEEKNNLTMVMEKMGDTIAEAKKVKEHLLQLEMERRLFGEEKGRLSAELAKFDAYREQKNQEFLQLELKAKQEAEELVSNGKKEAVKLFEDADKYRNMVTTEIEMMEKRGKEDFRKAVEENDQKMKTQIGNANSYCSNLKNNADAEYNKRKKEDEKLLALEKMKVIEQIKEFKASEEKKIIMAKKNEVESITMNLEALLRTRIVEMFHQKDKNVYLETLLLDIKNVVRGVLSGQNPDKGKALTNIIQYQPKSTREIVHFWIKIGTVIFLILFFSITHAIFPSTYARIFNNITGTIRPQQTANDIFMQQFKTAHANKPKFNPEQNMEFRDNYTDNILYLKFYKEIKQSAELQNSWVIGLNKFIVNDLELGDNIILDYISFETKIINQLIDSSFIIKPEFMDEGIEKMRIIEAEYTSKLKELFGGEEAFLKMREFEKKFYLKNVQSFLQLEESKESKEEKSTEAQTEDPSAIQSNVQTPINTETNTEDGTILQEISE